MIGVLTGTMPGTDFSSASGEIELVMANESLCHERSVTSSTLVIEPEEYN
jgi:hypothetical protein